MAPKLKYDPMRDRPIDSSDYDRPSKIQRNVADNNLGRKSQLKAMIISLNTQFQSWVNNQGSSRTDELWTAGVKDYLRHVEELMQEYCDIVPGGGNASSLSNGTVKSSKDLTSSFPAPNMYVSDLSGASFASSAPTSEPLGNSSSTATAITPSAEKVRSELPATSFNFFLPTSAPANGTAETAPVVKSTNDNPPSIAMAVTTSVSVAKDNDTAPKPFFCFGSNSSAATTASSSASTASASSSFIFGSNVSKAPAVTSDNSAAASAPAFTFGSAASTSTANPAGSLFTFKAATANSDTVSAAPSLFTFGTSSTASSSTSISAPSTTSSLFSFGSGSAASASATGAALPAFTFGGSTASTAPAAFTFGGSAAAAGAGPAAGGGDADAEGEDEGPKKFESEVAVSEEAGSIAFKAKAKFSHLVKDENGKSSWESKGMGTLMVRVRNDGSNKPFVTFTTEAGRVLYIANVSKTMKLIIVEGRPQVTFAAPWSPDGTSTPTLQSVMFALPKGRNTEFKTEVEKLQATM